MWAVYIDIYRYSIVVFKVSDFLKNTLGKYNPNYSFSGFKVLYTWRCFKNVPPSQNLKKYYIKTEQEQTLIKI